MASESGVCFLKNVKSQGEPLSYWFKLTKPGFFILQHEELRRYGASSLGGWAGLGASSGGAAVLLRTHMGWLIGAAGALAIPRWTARKLQSIAGGSH